MKRAAWIAVLSSTAMFVVASPAQETADQHESPTVACDCPTGPQRGDIAVTTVFHHTNVTKHYFSLGEALDRGHIRSNTLDLSLDYAVTDRLFTSVAVPYVSSSYFGKFPHQLPIDDGAAHGTFQDYRVDVQYDIPIRRMHVTPVVGFIAPTHNYQFLGHSVVGRDLHEQSAGVNVERDVNELLPGSYVQTRYVFSFVEKVHGMSHNRSNIDVNLGYFILPALSLRGLWSLQKTYGGIDHVLNEGKMPDFPYHDQIERTDYVAAGVGASYSISDAIDLFVAAERMLHGRNGNKLNLSPTIGVTWTFAAARRHAASRPSSSTPSKQ
jgi:hypothetical protein